MNVVLFLLGLAGAVTHASPALQPKPLPNESYGEAYTAVASLEDGSFVLLQLMFTNAGVGSRKAACRALWVPSGGTGLNASTHMSSNEWSYDEVSETLTAGDCVLGTVDGGVRFRADVPDLSIELRIDGGIRRIAPRGHRIEHNNSFYEAELLIPYGKSTAVIESKGVRVTTSGPVHLDHSRSNLLMPNAAACWVRFRGFFGSAPTLFQARIPPGGGVPQAWVWPLSAGQPTTVAGEKVTIEQSESGILTITIGGAQPVAISSSKTLFVYRPAESYGALGRLASPWIGNPTTTTYRANGRSGTGTVSGILEVLDVDEPGCTTQ